MTSTLLDERLAAMEDLLRRLYIRLEHPQDDRGAESAAPACVPAWPNDRILGRLAASGDRLALLLTRFGLTTSEGDLLLTCLLPEVDPVCGAAVRQLSGRAGSRPPVSLVLSVHDISVPDALARGLFRSGSRLLTSGLVAYEDVEVPFPERALTVSDRLLDFLYGNDAHVRSRTSPWLRVLPPDQGLPGHPGALERATLLRQALTADPRRTLYLRQGIAGEALAAARAALLALGLGAVLIDPDLLDDDGARPPWRHADAALEARLLGAAVLVPVPAPGTATPEETDRLRRLVTHLDGQELPLLLYGFEDWAGYEWGALRPDEIDLRSAASLRPHSRLGAAASAAVERRHRAGVFSLSASTLDDLRATARTCSASELGRLARHVVPETGRHDLVLPGRVREQLDLLVSRVRHREEVFRTWPLRRGGGRGHGTSALFAGESGTGKTMAAEALAHELGLDLYVISIPSLVSKYIGETEKNLERVFSAAELLGSVVLFDEADAMFAKRSEVKGSNDRHANMQSGYLLQRLEAFDGLAVLTTNLRSNIDSAFTRRFDEVVHFEIPEPEVRARLWRSLLGDRVPDGLPIEELADAYDLAGGSIRAGIETAVFAATAAGRALNGDDLLRGIETEYGKLGRLFNRPA
ncbi:ATP-binding protein [Streptomyces sp. NPDC092307]|uniref:ATP-binding protein n=1 Tax=Streptomyces sp. NPDC092307 TaxID=3366013 RepID=UPI0038196D8E